MKAPSLAEMEAMAHQIFERLPKGFRDLCEGVIVRVDDFPTEEVLDEMQAESRFDGGALHARGLQTRGCGIILQSVARRG